jgi:thiamine biosynthesis protein ThiS
LQIQLNGENHELAATCTLEDLVRELSLTPQRVAIELNRSVVRRDQWTQTVLKEGDRVEIVHFVGGGCQTACVSGRALLALHA